MSDEDVMQTARELLERSAALQQELEHFFQREAEQGQGFMSSGDQSSEDTGTAHDEQHAD